MKKILLLLFLFPLVVYAQHQGDIWYFGDSVGLSFASGTPVFMSGGQTAYIGCPACHAEGTSVICDATGKLLFYSDGRRVWDRHHRIMPHGDSLMSNISGTQSSIIIPMPDSPSRYYLFTVDDLSVDHLAHGVNYSIIDMCLNETNGDVVQSRKNVHLLDTVTEKLTAVRHANGTDYWVLVHKYGSDAFYSYLVSASGITDTVVSHVGSVHITSTSFGIGSQGQMKASPDGTKLAVANSNVTPSVLEYFSFDKNTGVVSAPVSLQWNPNYGFYGLSFSPDNTKLYVSGIQNSNGLYQFDLSAGGGDSAAVRSSRTMIAGTYNFIGLQLANNGKIYVAHSPFLHNRYIAAIDSPNSVGPSCHYIDSAVYLNGHDASYGFPDFVDSYDYPNTSPQCVTSVGELEAVTLNVYPDPFSSQLSIDAGVGRYDFHLYDIMGREIMRTGISGLTTLDMHHLSLGVYMYVLSGAGNASHTGKVVKQ